MLDRVVQALELCRPKKNTIPSFYGVIDRCATGVPLDGNGTYEQKVAIALTKLSTEHGWSLVTVIGSTFMVFRKDYR